TYLFVLLIVEFSGRRLIFTGQFGDEKKRGAAGGKIHTGGKETGGAGATLVGGGFVDEGMRRSGELLGVFVGVERRAVKAQVFVVHCSSRDALCDRRRSERCVHGRFGDGGGEDGGDGVGVGFGVERAGFGREAEKRRKENLETGARDRQIQSEERKFQV